MSSYLALKLGYINKTYTKGSRKRFISSLSDHHLLLIWPKGQNQTITFEFGLIGLILAFWSNEEEVVVVVENNLVPRAFPLKKWVGREKALVSASHVYSLNIPEKLIYMQPAGFALTEVERSNSGK